MNKENYEKLDLELIIFEAGDIISGIDSQQGEGGQNGEVG